ncbi:hypothetical protein M8C13_28020 [Crossiella sp. SN42]|uniref:hypothetical protein n=1 Tax=unclassified Crossiella TaxID=2620835 RepID=UPI00207CF9C3|nr:MULTISPECIES: hypothetical protein [unclassified Crossiella]MCO1579605.1 hypothetical protein [Crossiella sp. SN42]WHT19356.1 hypothetical protein N8J89_40795 [Crossiella sp. CA-258035]
MEELRTLFKAGPGGVMTDDVGVITGDLELLTRCDPAGEVTTLVTYEGAEEWYRLTGGSTHLHDAKDHEPLHRTLAAVLDRPNG